MTNRYLPLAFRRPRGGGATWTAEELIQLDDNFERIRNAALLVPLSAKGQSHVRTGVFSAAIVKHLTTLIPRIQSGLDGQPIFPPEFHRVWGALSIKLRGIVKPYSSGPNNNSRRLSIHPEQDGTILLTKEMSVFFTVPDCVITRFGYFEYDEGQALIDIAIHQANLLRNVGANPPAAPNGGGANPGRLAAAPVEDHDEGNDDNHSFNSSSPSSSPNSSSSSSSDDEGTSRRRREVAPRRRDRGGHGTDDEFEAASSGDEEASTAVRGRSPRRPGQVNGAAVRRPRRSDNESEAPTPGDEEASAAVRHRSRSRQTQVNGAAARRPRRSDNESEAPSPGDEEASAAVRHRSPRRRGQENVEADHLSRRSERRSRSSSRASSERNDSSRSSGRGRGWSAGSVQSRGDEEDDFDAYLFAEVDDTGHVDGVYAPDNNAGAADPPPPPGADEGDNNDEDDGTGRVSALGIPPPRPRHHQDGVASVQAAANHSALGLNQGEGGTNVQALASPNAIGLNHRAGGANVEPAGIVADANFEGYDENLGRRTEASRLRHGASILGGRENQSRDAGARDRNDKRPGEPAFHPSKRQRNDTPSSEEPNAVRERGVALVANAELTGPEKATGGDEIVPPVVAGLTVLGGDAPPVDAEVDDDGPFPSVCVAYVKHDESTQIVGYLPKPFDREMQDAQRVRFHEATDAFARRIAGLYGEPTVAGHQKEVYLENPRGDRVAERYLGRVEEVLVLMNDEVGPEYFRVKVFRRNPPPAMDPQTISDEDVDEAIEEFRLRVRGIQDAGIEARHRTLVERDEVQATTNIGNAPRAAGGNGDGVALSLADGGVDRDEVTVPSRGTGDGLDVRRENFLRELDGMSDSQSFLISLLPLAAEAAQGQTSDLQAARKRNLDLEGTLRQKDDQLKESQIQVEQLKAALREKEGEHVTALSQKDEVHLAAIRHVEAQGVAARAQRDEARAQRDEARGQRDALQVELDAVIQNHEDELVARRAARHVRVLGALESPPNGEDGEE